MYHLDFLTVKRYLSNLDVLNDIKNIVQNPLINTYQPKMQWISISYGVCVCLYGCETYLLINSSDVRVLFYSTCLSVCEFIIIHYFCSHHKNDIK